MDLEKDARKLSDSIEYESYADLDESDVTTANILTGSCACRRSRADTLPTMMAWSIP